MLITADLKFWIEKMRKDFLDSKKIHEIRNEFLETIGVEVSALNTHIFVCAEDLVNEEKNISQVIPCKNGESLKGYVRDIAKDSYIFHGIEWMVLGIIPFSFKILFPENNLWTINVPIPEKMVEKFLAPYYKKKLKDFKNKYPLPNFEMNFIQMLAL